MERTSFQVNYREGDAVTVIMDFDANTVAFCKNGKAAMGSPQSIPHEAYYFAFDANYGQLSATIESMW